MELREIPERGGPNFLQCMAVSEYVLGSASRARDAVDAALRATRTIGPTPIFSCWRYLNVKKEGLLEDLEEMVRQIDSKGPFDPPVSSGSFTPTLKEPA